MKKMKKLLLLFGLIFGLSSSVFSQGCGTVDPTTDPIPAKMHPAYQMFSQNFVNNMNSGSRSMLLDTIPYKIHVVRTNSGTGGITTAQLTTAFNIVNGLYANANMYLKQCGTINYIDNSTYFDFDQSSQTALTTPNNVTNVINIYFFNSITSSSGSGLCGYAYFPGGPDLIMMANSCATNGSTLSHEIGHYFNLSHTHSTSNGIELVNGTNCSSAGDLLCDTPADPQLSNSSVSTSCIYTGSATDPNGAAYAPDVTNLMSYSRKSCRSFFSPQQYARISFSALNQRAYLVCSAGGGGGTGLINGCAATSQYPAGTFTPTGAWQTTASNIYAGEYSVYNVTAGDVYEWSLCTADGGSASYDSELTLTDASNNELDFNDDFCSTQSKITWTATITGTVRVHVTEYHCLTNTTSTTLVYKKQASSGSPNLSKVSDNLTIAGNSVTISATIQNSGTAAAGVFSVRFYASTDMTISTSDIEIYTGTATNGLAVGASAAITNVTIDLCTITALTNNTTYYIGYIIDYANTVAESNEIDNIWGWTNPSVALNCVTGCLGTSQYPATIFTPTTSWQTASALIYAGEYSVHNVVSGEIYEWSLCTADGGSASYDSELTLTNGSNTFIDYNDDFCSTQSKITWTATFTGVVRVHVTQHNCQTNTTNTTLVYKKQGLSSPNLTKQTDNISASGNNVTVGATIENNGGTTAGAFDVRFYASTNTIISTGDIPIYTATISSLAANATSIISQNIDLCSITSLNDGSSYYIGYIIDYTNVVAESDETDNTFAWTATNYTLNCVTTSTISLSANPTAGGTVSGAGTFNNGQSVTVTASANTGWNFTGWSENGTTVSTNANYAFSVTANRTLTAEFSQIQYTISTSANPITGGSTSGGGTFINSQSVTVTASANTGWNFTGWSENGMTVSTNANYAFSVTANRTLTAEFSQQQFAINVTADSLQGGIISGGGNYTYGQQVTVTATPNASSPWIFEGWYENGTYVSNAATYTFTAVANRDLMANFDFDVNTKFISKVAANLILSPNPTTNLLQIQIEHPTLNFDKIQIYNMVGQLVQTENLNNQKSKTISVDSLPAGTYVIQIYSEDESQVIVDKILVAK